MQCLFLFRDSAGRLPTAQDLRKCGFKVSEAALPTAGLWDMTLLAAPPPAEPELQIVANGLATAAEPKSHYGDQSGFHRHDDTKAGSEDAPLPAKAEAGSAQTSPGA
ncbi:MAG: hypothetical protein Q8O35_01425 [Humidesulfovibrio sp.]|uniref:hypothetical protein n=1 Tax=Humidesulfovibrio sp. TaxID=2910988 RepID=UPI0027362501|nr:hypothetical protein [Humidesulfovibrio sp.]MDP2846833.1 hypothetical protein [Humidesulfovibrio sp.]